MNLHLFYFTLYCYLIKTIGRQYCEVKIFKPFWRVN